MGKVVQENTKVDPTKELSKDHFCGLFEQVPLNEDERELVKTAYWGIYSACLTNGVTATESWLATKNTFQMNESQIQDRMIQL